MKSVIHKRPPGGRVLAVAAAASALVSLAACGTSGSSGTSVTMAVADQSAFISLPVALAQQLGYYAKEGLSVKLQSVTGGAQAANALVSGGVDTSVVAFDTLLQLNAKNPGFQSFATLTRYYTGLLVAAPGNTKINSVAALAHTTVGVTSPGSSSERFVQYLLSRHGVAPSSVSFVGVGAGETAIAALEHGKVSTAFLLQPALTLLQKQNPGKRITVLADTQNAAGDKAVFNSANYPATVLAAKRSWLSANSATARKVSKAIMLALQWIQQHSAEQIAGKVPTSFYGGDKATYTRALAGLKDSFSPDATMPVDGANAVDRVLRQFQPGYSSRGEAVSKSYTNSYLPAS